MKGLMTLDRPFMSHDSQIGYLRAMINGHVNKCIASWALSPQTIFLENCLAACAICFAFFAGELAQGGPHSVPRPNAPLPAP